MTVIWLVLILLAVVGWLIHVFNSLVSLSNTADAAWADIDVQLKRRYDLVPNLVEVTKGYAGHESDTFAKVARPPLAVTLVVPSKPLDPRLRVALTTVLLSVVTALPN